MYVTMSAKTDRAKAILASPGSLFSCSKVLTFTGAATDTCLWTDAITIKVTIGSKSAYARAGDVLSLKEDTVKAFCDTFVPATECSKYLFAFPSSVLIDLPANPIVPSPIILGPNSISRCGDITLDTTMSSGRGGALWRELSWHVSSKSLNPTKIVEEHLNTATINTAAVFTVPNGMIKNGTYSFRFCASNHFLQTACASWNVTVSENRNEATVLLSGPKATFRYKSFAVTSRAFVPGCNDESPSVGGLKYKFNLYESAAVDNIALEGLGTESLIDTGMVSTSKNSRVFKLNSHTLEPDTFYLLGLAVTTAADITSHTYLTFSVSRAPVRAIISQGSYATVFERSFLTLDASLSYDLDYPDDSTNLRFRWTCTQYYPEFGNPCGTQFPSAAEIVFDGTHFNTTFEYLLTVFVWNPLNEDSTDSSSVVVLVQPGLPIPALTFSDIAEKYNPNSRVLLNAIVSTSFQSSRAAWSAYDSAGELIDLNPISLTSLDKVLSVGSSNFGLTIAKNSFSEGGTYTLRLSATYFPSHSPDQAETHSEMVIFINEAPSGGEFSVWPPTGTSLNTSFYLNMYDWADNIDDYPLEYRFISYSSESSQGNLVRDYSSVSYMTTYIAQGLELYSFNVTCLASVADNLGLSTSRTESVKVFPQFNDLTLLESASVLLNISEGVPELIQQILNALVANFNFADCSSAPLCESFFREECSLTDNTCGPCLTGYPIGQPGDSNSECLPDPTSGGGELNTEIASLVIPIPLVSGAAGESKTCPRDCSNNGRCVFYDWIGGEIGSCVSIDTSCRAECLCVDDFYGADCSLTLSEFVLDREAKELICGVAYRAKDGVDVSAVVVETWAKLVSNTFTDTTKITDTALTNCSRLIVESVLEYPYFSVTDASMPSVVDALSHVLEFRTRLPESIFDDVILSIEALNVHRQLIMSPGEEPISIYTKNLRYSTLVDYLGTLVNTTSRTVPLSALEIATNRNASSVSVISDNAVNGSIANTIVTVGISAWEVLVYTGFSYINSSRVELQTNVLYGPLDTAPSDTITIVLFNHEPIFYSTGNVITGTVDCYTSTSMHPYTTSINCEDTLDFIMCPGNVSVKVDYQCGYSYDTPECLTWDGYKYEKNPSCYVSEFDSYSTTCTCSAARIRRSLQQSDYSFDNPQYYDFSSSKFVTKVELQMEVSLATEIPNLTRNYVFIFIVALIFTVTSLIGGALLLPRQKSKYCTESIPLHYEYVLTCAHELLRPGYERKSNVFVRAAHGLFLHSEYFSIFRWREDLSDAKVLELFEGWSTLVGSFLKFMTTHAVLAYVMYGDDGVCQRHLSETSCVREESVLQQYSKCEWRSDGHPYCHLRSPVESAFMVVVLLCIAAVATLPMTHYWSIGVECVISRYWFSDGARIAISTDQDSLFSSGEQKMRKFDSRKVPKDMVTNDGTLLRSVEDEIIYVLSEGKNVVVENELEASAMSVPGLHRRYLMDQLGMDRNGNIREWSFPLTKKPRELLVDKLRQARQISQHFQSVVSCLENDEFSNCFLIEQFLLHSLPASLRFYAVKHFFNRTTFAVEFQGGNALRKFCGYSLPAYIIVCLAVVLYVGFQWYGRTTNVAWGIFVCSSVVLDFLVFSPMRILIHSFVIPEVFMNDLRRVHTHLKTRYAHVMSRMKTEAAPLSFELVQHFNPSCRAARQIESATAVMDSLMWVTDTDLPRLVDAHNDSGLCSTVKLFTIAKYFLSGVYKCVPEIAVDFAIDSVMTISVCACAVGLYVLGTVTAVASILIGIAIFAVIVSLTYLLTRNVVEFHHVDGKSEERVFHAGGVLRSILSGVELPGESRDIDVTSVREALLSCEVTKSDLDFFVSTKIHRKSWDELPSPAGRSAKVVPTTAYNTRSPGRSELDASLNGHKDISVPSVLEKGNPETAVVVPTVDKVSTAAENSLLLETPRSRANLLAPISLAKSTVSGLDQPSATKSGRIHISGRDYHILTTAVAKFLLMREDEQVDGGYSGSLESEIVEWVVQQSLGSRKLSNSSDKIALLVKRETKILRKVLKRMVEKDKSVTVTTNGVHGNLYNLSEDRVVRQKFVSVSSIKQRKVFLPLESTPEVVIVDKPSEKIDEPSAIPQVIEP